MNTPEICELCKLGEHCNGETLIQCSCNCDEGLRMLSSKTTSAIKRDVECRLCGSLFARVDTVIAKNAAGRPERMCRDCSQDRIVLEHEFFAALEGVQCRGCGRSEDNLVHCIGFFYQ